MGKKLTTDDFIKAARKVHGDAYDYSQTSYYGRHQKLTILCRTHGAFEQKAGGHLSGQGCDRCGGTYTHTTEEFIIQSKKTHGKKYDYTQTTYTNNKIPVIIKCLRHGEFRIRPDMHLHRKEGCPVCGKIVGVYKRTKTTNTFIAQAKTVHSNKYQYEKTDYKDAKSKVIITCPEHGDFKQTPQDHLAKCGCPECGKKLVSKKLLSTTNEFISNAKTVHSNKYQYEKTDYKDAKSKVIITCPEHGDFKQTPGNHLFGQGCYECGKILVGEKCRSEVDEIILKAKAVHRDVYDYSKVSYKTNKVPVIIICPKHGEFKQCLNNHLNGQECPFCAKGKSFSQVSIDWLTGIEKQTGVMIQHMGHGAEYRIPKTQLRVDGYCKETNTVYEFYGNAWHGNPAIFSPSDKCHPRDKNITAQELYEATLKREDELKQLGYSLVTVWELDYRRNLRTELE